MRTFALGMPALMLIAVASCSGNSNKDKADQGGGKPEPSVQTPPAEPSPAPAPAVAVETPPAVDDAPEPAGDKCAFGPARALDKQGKLEEARAAFEALRAACDDELAPAKKLWLLSELSLLHHKLGDDAACLETLEQFEAAWVVESPKAARAMQHNAKLCSHRPDDDDACDYYTDDSVYCGLALAIELAPRQGYADAVATACPFQKDAVRLPGDGERCIGLEGGRTVELEEYENGDDDVCAQLVLYDKAGGEPRERVLEPPDVSLFSDPSDCCHLNENELKVTPAGLVVVAGGPNRDCFGGTASVDEFVVMKLEGTRLVMVADLSVLMH